MVGNPDDLPLEVAKPGLRLGVHPKQHKERLCSCEHREGWHDLSTDISPHGCRTPGCPCQRFHAKPKSSRRKSKTAKATKVVLNAITEADFQQLVIQTAEANGWLIWHDRDSRRNRAGLPDLLMIRGPVLLFLELKTEKGKVRPEQEAFIGRLKQVKYVHADVVRPRHFEQIAQVLRSAKR